MARPPTSSPQKFFHVFLVYAFFASQEVFFLPMLYLLVVRRYLAPLSGAFFRISMIMVGGEDMQTGVIMGIRVEKGVALPMARVDRKYPHEDMAVGDSFLIANVSMQVVLNANWRAGKRLGAKFVARKEGEGIRVWRTA